MNMDESFETMMRGKTKSKKTVYSIITFERSSETSKSEQFLE